MKQKKSTYSLIVLYWLTLLTKLLVVGLMVRIFFKDIPMTLKHFNEAANISGRLNLLLILSGLIVLITAILVLKTFQRLLKNLSAGRTFTEQNLLLLTRFSIGLTLFALFDFLHILFGSAFLLDINGNKIPIPYTFLISILIIALFVWSLRHIFRTGMYLKKDNDLVI